MMIDIENPVTETEFMRQAGSEPAKTFQLEIHIVAKADNMEILELAKNRIDEILHIYSNEDDFLRFWVSKLTIQEFCVGVTEVSNV